MASIESNRHLDEARALDAADSLRDLRSSFALPARDGRALAYLCGHSLGLMPVAARSAIDAELSRWARDGVAGHFGDAGWYDYADRFRAPLARLIGARDDEVVAMNSLTVNLHLMLVSFFRPDGRRRKIAIEANAFPSDRYAVKSQLRYHGLDADGDLIEIDAAGGALTTERLDHTLGGYDGEVALVLLPGVQFLSGEALDLPTLAAVARRHGARVGFDLAHAIGNLEIDIAAADADFAVWCSYKYLNGGPGAVGGCYVNGRWLDDPPPRFEGWWGHDSERRFALDASFKGKASAEAWQLSNPPVLSMTALESSLDLFDKAGLGRLRAKSIELTAFLERLIDDKLGERVAIVTPRDPARRGCQLSLRIDLGARAGIDLAARLHEAGVVGDWREPDILRLAPVPLYNTFEDVCRAVTALDRILGP